MCDGVEDFFEIWRAFLAPFFSFFFLFAFAAMAPIRETADEHKTLFFRLACALIVPFMRVGRRRAFFSSEEITS
jgi:hypothetical protein